MRPTSLLFTASLLLASVPASASDLVLLAEGTDASRAAPGSDGGAVRVLSWADFLASQKPTARDLDLEPCSGPPTSASEISALEDQAVRALNYMDFAAAGTALVAAQTAAVCATEPVPSTVLARTWYLQGMLAFVDGDEALAEQHWSAALVFNPGLQWDDAFEPSGKPVFESRRESSQRSASATVVLVPDEQHTLYVDGVPRFTGPNPLPGGRHLVQLGAQGPGFWMTVPGGQRSTVVIPALLPEDPSEALARPAAADALGLLLDVREPSATVTLVLPETTHVRSPEGTWQEVKRVAARDPAQQRKRRIRRSITGGIALALAGSASATYIRGAQLRVSLDEGEVPLEDVNETIDRTNRLWTTTLVLGGGSLAAAATLPF